MFTLPHGSPSRAAVAPEIEMRIEPNTLRFQCPNTGREIDSGINKPWSTRLISIRVRCPICDKFHDWKVADATLGPVLPADRRSNDARLTKARGALHDFQGGSTQIDDLREQLLDELNHRLKNLQMLHGLLLIALHKTDNSEAREVSLHSLLNGIQEWMVSKEVSINYEATTGSLPKESAVPLALALNELLTNVAKHGADDRGRITINVGLSQRSGEIELRVQDCGSGFNLDEVQGRMSGLGLVATLAKRLKGTFTVERRFGARCTLKFPDQ